MCGTDIFLAILAVLFPPIAVWVKRGLCSGDSLINIALCCLGFLPGLIHAWYIIVTYPDEYSQVPQDAEGGTVTYYYVSSGPRQGQRQQRGQGYGTVNSQPSQQFPGQQSGVYFPQPQQQQSGKPQKSAPASGPPQVAGPADGPSNPAAPPSYADAIKGDNKIQSNE